ncbi:MAG: 4-hydroxy-tetrahydrodipicolinate reductase [Clostridia bacterium]|nr:4-hydroxy-tetrahydrodipicolinate reductase [Clostridia bacterium]
MNKTMKILLSGFNGHMGKEVAALCAAGYRGAELAVGVDIVPTEAAVPVYTDFNAIKEKADVIVDFSHHSAIVPLLAYAKRTKTPVVVATTGQNEAELAAITEAAKEIPVFFSANMSYGVALLLELAKKTAAALPEAEIEIIEKHHDRKIDAPSGTALMLANGIMEVRPEAFTVMGRSGHAPRTKAEIGIHSLRMGNVVGEHEVIVATQNQTITLKHEAHSRALFAEGALAAAAFLCGKEAGLYSMKDMV